MSEANSRAVTLASSGQSFEVIGTTIAGRYKVEALLGKGGMGAVYLVQHTLIRKRLALKMLHAEVSQNPEMVARFEREAVAAANMDHPNIAAATDFGRAEDGSFFLAMEYLEGQRLRDALGSGPVPVQRVVHIARQVASALSRSHELGVIHRDLKPENIMLIARQGDLDFVKVLDFGLAKLVAQAPGIEGDKPGQSLTKHGTVFGTPKYMAPEQCVSGPVDGRTDLYALGLIMYEMLTGAHPFEARQIVAVISHQLATPMPSIKNFAPAVSVPAALEAIVMRLTAKEPESRPASATALLAELTEFERPAAAPEAPEAPKPVEPSPPSLPRVSAPPAPPAPAAPAPQKVGSADAAPAPLSAAGSPATRFDPLNTLRSILIRMPAPIQKTLSLLLLPLLLFGLLIFIVVRVETTANSGASATKRNVTQAVAAADLATKPQIDQAIASGPQALLELSKQFPQDARVKRSLAHVYMAQENSVDALRWLAQAMAIDGKLVVDGEILQAARQAGTTADSLDASIGILESEFGARGVDVLYALLTGSPVHRIKLKYGQSLARPEVRAHATPAAAIAIGLHAAESCEAKRALLPRATQEGDGRALEQLRMLTQRHNCGRYGLLDCWACLRKDSALDDAIAAIAARIKSER